MSILSTREWATLIWGCIFMLYVLCHWEIRKSLWNVIVIFFDKKLRILWEIILLYVLTITMVFCYLPIWENIYIKDIIIWFLFSGLIYCMNAVSSEADETYIKKILKDNLKFTMILEFFMSTFTFNIWIELAIIPVITIIIVMNVIAERKEEYKSVHKLLDSILAIAGFWIFYETIKIGINEYKQLNIINTLVSFMIPIVYLILIIPLEYMVDMAEVEKDEVPGNPYRVQEDVEVENTVLDDAVEADVITEPKFESVVDDELETEVETFAETAVTGLKTVGKTAVTNAESVVKTDIDVMAESIESGLQNDDIRQIYYRRRLTVEIWSILPGLSCLTR